MFTSVLILSFFWLVESYNVALVEYYYDRQVFLKLPPIDAANRNAKIYSDIVGSIKNDHMGLDIVVFPESTLVAEPLNTPSGRLAMTFVPRAEDRIVPCNSSDKLYADFFRSLSCAARKFNTYLVINLKEKDVKENVMKFYNTDVVFDRNGQVIARYRKNHIYLEQDTNIPEIPELVSFETDFGETFGIFTCFDIIFKTPAIQLVRKNIKNFIFPTLWIPELPFLTTNQVQQMWAQGNDVTLLASGAALPEYGSGGLGIYLGNNMTLAKAVTPRTDNFYLYRELSKYKEKFDSKCSVTVDDDIAKEMDQYAIFQEDLSGYTYESLNFEASNTIQKKLCQNGLCCDFNIEIDKVEKEVDASKKQYEYLLVIRNGVRSYGKKTYTNALETCGLIACTGPTLEHCGKRFPKYDEISWPIVFKKISVSGVFGSLENKMQFPNSLLADFSPVPPPCTTWTSEPGNLKSEFRRTFSTKTMLSKILTFAIFGRNYAEDE